MGRRSAQPSASSLSLSCGKFAGTITRLRSPTPKAVLTGADKRGQLVDAHVFDITLPRHRERDPWFASWEDAETLASWMPDSIARIAPFALATCLRQGELLRLTESDVDLVRATLIPRNAKTRNGVRRSASARSRCNCSAAATRSDADRHGLIFPTPTGQK
jgi:integrase